MPTHTANDAPPSHERRVAIPRALSISALRRPAGALQVLSGTSMGTSWTVTFAGSPGITKALRAAIERVLARVVAQMSPWEPQSDLSRFNAGPCNVWQTLPPEFCDVIACALRIAEETDGACDPALGTLVDLWGFGPVPRRTAFPPPEAIDTALATSGWRSLRFDSAGRRLMRTTPLRLDLNGIAKGFAVDWVAQVLREHGIIDALVEIGGELSGRGVKPDGSPWWVAVDETSAAPGIAPLVVALHGQAIATSGCERSFQHDGRTYSHTIDPRSGMPIDNGMLTATVLHDSCMQADAYATALMVMEPERALAFANDKQLPAIIRFRTTGIATIAESISAPLQAMLED
jgi:thiamine biosynthesis lipoprotein